MRTMHPSIRIAIAIALVCCWCDASHASHWRVGPDADFTTIQAALDACCVDSVLIAPGVYPESLQVGAYSPVLLGLEGAAATRMETIRATSSASHWTICGLTLSADLSLPGAGSYGFRGCVFDGQVQVSATVSFVDCDFHDRTAINDQSSLSVFRDLRFHAAPLFVQPNATGPNGFSECTFEGPVDTLVTGGPGEDGIWFGDCEFKNAGYGVVVLAPGYGTVSPTSFGHCSFQDLSSAAIYFDDTPWPTAHQPGRHYVAVGSSRFDRCGQALVWRTCTPSEVGMQADTICSTLGEAITITPYFDPAWSGLRNLVIEGGKSHGVVVDISPNQPLMTSLLLEDSHISRFAGDGVLMHPIPGSEQAFHSTIRHCTSSQNGGDGFDVSTAGVTLADNLAWGNGDHGIRLASGPINNGRPDSILSNTCVDNDGDGIRLTHGPGGAGQAQIVQRNLVASNGAIGLDAPEAASVAFNDAWNNAMGDYAGVFAPTDSNLIADPLFCDAPLRDYALQEGSPCAPAGLYGLIGALPVGCPTASVEPAGGDATLTFAPNPFRGSLVFTAPSRAGLLEVFDLQGRRLWSRALRADEQATWDGRSFGRRVPAGVYNVRFTTVDEVLSGRLVRLP